MVAWIPYGFTVITPTKLPVVVKNPTVKHMTIIHYVPDDL
jgi:hypothetical protein